MNAEEYLRSQGIEPSATLPQETQGLQVKPNSVELMRQQLEVRKLQIELDKLEKPDTSIDYYSKMLELQKENFKTQLEMATQQGDLKLEIEKLKLQEVGGSDDFMDILKPLLPILPQLLKGKTQTPAKTQEVSEDKPEGVSPSSKIEQVVTGGNEMDITKETTVGELQEYVEAIKSGEITFDEALEDFKNSPYANLLTEEQFKEKFDKILNTKTI